LRIEDEIRMTEVIFRACIVTGDRHSITGLLQ
jgi:hypothetical protein